MRKASRRLTQLYDEALEPCGLRSTQLAILVELARHTTTFPTMLELARSLVIDRSALGHNLKPLERDGLVALEEGDADRRRRHIRLTAKGKVKLAEGVPLWAKAQERFDQVFGKTKAMQLRATLLDIANDERLAALMD
jgi:DNA-binding MarR family transcriptional regulator